MIAADEGYEKIVLGLRLLSDVLEPFDHLFRQLSGDINKFIDDPFDIKNRVEISEQRMLYENFGENPLHAWQALKLWKKYGFTETPLWAVNAVSRSAEALTQLGTANSTLDSALKKAMGIDGHKIAQYEDNIRWLAIFNETHQLIIDGMMQKEAFVRISEKHEGHLAETTIEKHYFAIKAKLKDVPLPYAFDP